MYLVGLQVYKPVGFKRLMNSLDCTESYSVNPNDEVPALRDPNDRTFSCENGHIVWIKGLFRYVDEHYVNSLTE